MLKNIFFIVSVFLLASTLDAVGFNKASKDAILLQKGDNKLWCPICGMNLKKFYKTNHSAKLKDGSIRQYCSLNCLVEDIQTNDLVKNSIKVVDAKTNKFIKAKDAFYVVKSRVHGTMSRVSKIAFGSKDDAKVFKKRFGGKIVSFDKAFKMTQDSLSSDRAMLNKKKQKMIYPMGKKIYNRICDKDSINPNQFKQVSDLKAYISSKHLCKNIKGKKLQAVALYLWDIERSDVQEDKAFGKIILTKDEKCPVCGMFVYKYPKWVAQIYFKHNDHVHHLSFDGVKDMMKFYFSPRDWGVYDTYEKDNITKIVVTDYYSQETIDGTKAYYVLGSDIYGPMGNELIPFKDKEDAKVFHTDHFGTKIVQFSDITEDIVYELDE